MMPEIKTERGTVWYADHRKNKTIQGDLILIHGAAGSHLAWPGQLRRLGALALDLPGHEKSPGTGRDDIKAYAADVLAFMDALDIERAVLVGHSMGGAIVQTIALDKPERVTGLVLIGTGAKLAVNPEILDNVKDRAEKVGSQLKDWMWADETPEAIRQMSFEQFLKIDPQVIYGDYYACTQFDVRDRLSEITTPTLVIGGSEDFMTPLKFSKYLAEHIANAELVTIEGGGHMMALEKPQVVTDAITSWLETQP